MLFQHLVHNAKKVLGNLSRARLQTGKKQFAAIGQGEPIRAFVDRQTDQVIQSLYSIIGVHQPANALKNGVLIVMRVVDHAAVKAVQRLAQ
ncbi:hypothetical protein D3C72_1266280 [compost metagenome]